LEDHHVLAHRPQFHIFRWNNLSFALDYFHGRARSHKGYPDLVAIRGRVAAIGSPQQLRLQVVIDSHIVTIFG